MSCLLAGYGATPIDEFGPEQLRAVRKGIIDAGLSRTTINGYQTRIVQMFGWRVGRSLVLADRWRVLKPVGQLQNGKGAARDKPKNR